MLKIGWSTVSITPDKPVMLDGQFHRRIATTVKDPVTATVLALEDGKSQTIFISCDLVGVSVELLKMIRDAIIKKTPEIAPESIIAFATHTHTAPVVKILKYELPDDQEIITPEEYLEFLSERVADATLEAWQTRSQGNISRAYSRAVVGHNRRASFFDETAKMYPKIDDINFDTIEGFEDHSVHILCTWDKNKNLTGMVVNLPCPSQATESLSEEISADFWHEARVDICKKLGKNIPILPQCAPAGDQSPHVLMHKKLQYEMYEKLGRTEREEIGRRISDAVIDVMPVLQTSIQENPVLAHISETLDLPPRFVTEKEKQHALDMIEELNNNPEFLDPKNLRPTTRQSFLNRDYDVLKRYEEQNEKSVYPIEFHAVRLGDVVFTTSPFELFLDFGERIYARSAAAQTFQIQLCCGYEGYLPTKRAIKEKIHPADKASSLGSAHNYSASIGSNKVGPEGGQLLVEHSLKRIAELMRV